jgi:putative sigma-54 modulation protein
MKITYTGNPEPLASKQRDKFEAKLQKMSKMLDRRGEREAHVIITKERFLQKVEVAIHAFDHAMVGVGSNSDLQIAMSDALEKLEKQIIRLRSKWRDTKRHKDKEAMVSAEPESRPSSSTAAARPKPARERQRVAAPATAKKTPRVFRVNHKDGRKPMTLEEAMLEVEESQDYLVYHDAGTDRLTVLLRRADGNFDLIES